MIAIDYNPLNKVGILRYTLRVECQLINVKRTMELEKALIGVIVIIVDSDQKILLILKLMNENEIKLVKFNISNGTN